MAIDGWTDTLYSQLFRYDWHHCSRQARMSLCSLPLLVAEVPISGTYQAAYDAVQVALTALDILLQTPDETATFALCRPPGNGIAGHSVFPRSFR